MALGRGLFSKKFMGGEIGDNFWAFGRGRPKGGKGGMKRCPLIGKPLEAFYIPRGKKTVCCLKII